MKREIEFKHESGVIVVEVEEGAPRGDQLGSVEGTVAKAKVAYAMTSKYAIALYEMIALFFNSPFWVVNESCIDKEA